MNNNTHLPELFIKGIAQRLALGEDGSVGLCLPAPRAPLTCPAMALLQEPQRPLAWVGMPRRLRSDCSRPSMVSRPPLLVGPVGDGEPSSTELGPDGWVGPGAGSCSRGHMCVESARQQMWKGLKWAREPHIHTSPPACLTHVVLDSEVRE